jgi:type IV secretion system protein TrbG
MNKLILLLIIVLFNSCTKPVNNIKTTVSRDFANVREAGAITELEFEPKQIKTIEPATYTVTNTGTLLANALKHAKQRPEDCRFLNATTIYDFIPGSVYQIYTAPQKVTMISFEPGEMMMAAPQSGDTVRWQVNSITSGTGANARQHLIIKPLREELTNNMIITTNKNRVYLLELISFKNSYMLDVSWNYAASNLIMNHEPTKKYSDEDGLPKKLNFNYKVINKSGKPIWKPTRVFDNGEKTFIEFPAVINHHELPTLFIVSRETTTQLVNYRQKGDILMVDRLFVEAELRLGLLNPEIVRIKRMK